MLIWLLLLLLLLLVMLVGYCMRYLLSNVVNYWEGNGPVLRP